MKIASPGTRLSRMLMDNDSPGVKFGRTLGHGNALLVTAKRKRLKRIIEAEEGTRRWLGGSDKLLFIQPVQDGNVGPLFHLIVLC